MKSWLVLASACVLAACTADTSADTDTDSEAGSSGDASTTDPTATTPSTTGSGSSGSDSTPTTSTTTTATTTAATTSTTSDDDSSSSDTTATTGGDSEVTGCPADAPGSWVLCEDFDAIEDPATELSQWNVNGDGFGIEADESGDGDGDQVLRLTLTPGMQFGGWVTLRYGDGPDAPAVRSPEGRYDEVWARWRIRLNDEWPGTAAGDIGELISMNATNWGIAADLNIQVDGQTRIHPYAWTCIFNGEQACDGQNDWGGALDLLWNSAGDNQLFGSDAAGEWICVEAHMRLNDVGEANGETTLWVDGGQEFTRDGIDWRGTWDDFGLNAIRFTNFASPPPGPQSFFIDDVVVGTERVGCPD